MGARDPQDLDETLYFKRNSPQCFVLCMLIYTSTFAIAHVSPEEIDKLNILQASLLAMVNAVSKLNVKSQNHIRNNYIFHSKKINYLKYTNKKIFNQYTF